MDTDLSPTRPAISGSPEVLSAVPMTPIVGSLHLPEGDSAEAVRTRILLLKQITERCYLALAKELWDCYHRKLYLQYNYDTFDDYVAMEVGISKDRSYKLRRIFSVLVLKCGVSPSELEEAERSRVEMILGVVDRTNAREWVQAAKQLDYRDLKNKLTKARVSRVDRPQPAATAPNKPLPKPPVRIACEQNDAGAAPVEEEYHTRTFRLPDDVDTLLTEALGVAQRVTRSHSDNFNLACIAQQFLAHNLTVEGKDDGRAGYFLRWFEEIYGGHLLHIKHDGAWEVLAKVMEEHPDLFGSVGKRENTHGGSSDREDVREEAQDA